jgi:glycosyltransferase involved in cell wall biosynthesis
MRIGVIYLGRHGPGGPISLELASHLSKKADVFAVVSRQAEYISCWRESHLPLLEIPTFDTRIQALYSWASRRVREVARQVSSMRPDVLLCPMVHPWTPGLQKYLPDTPSVITVHDPAAHPGLLHRASSFWEIRSARLSSRCVVLADRFVQEMQVKGVGIEKIDVIPHAVFSFYDQFAAAPNAVRAPRSLLFFGRITEYKGLEVLLQAFKMLQSQRHELELHIVGEGDIRPYQRLIDNVKNVTVVNRWVDDKEVPGIFHSADAVIVPYTSASQSGVIALAATFGRPVIATRTGAIPEQIRDRETGLLVDRACRSRSPLLSITCLADEALRTQIAQRLSSEMRTKYNWSATADAYLESCRKALRAGKVR